MFWNNSGMLLVVCIKVSEPAVNGIIRVHKMQWGLKNEQDVISRTPVKVATEHKGKGGRNKGEGKSQATEWEAPTPSQELCDLPGRKKVQINNKNT